MIRHKLYFLFDKLQVSAVERYFMLSLTGIILFISGFGMFIDNSPTFDDEYYQPLMSAFEERIRATQDRNYEIENRYYPQVQVVNKELLGTKEQTKTLTPSIAPADTVTVQKDSTQSKININIADVDELVKLPGIGPAIAGRIIEYRNENGIFSSIEEIISVRGIGPARLEAIRELITVEKKSNE